MYKTLLKSDIDQLENRYRTQLINSLSGFKSANLIGTRSRAGIDNLALFSSCVHLGAQPALMGFISRPDSVPRDTLSNIRENGYFTVNHVSAAIHKQAHQCAARYDSLQSEFTETGLTPYFSPCISAPYVDESPVKIGLQLAEIMPIKLNNTYLIIGEVIEIIAPHDAFLDDGTLSPEAAGSVSIGGLNHYYQCQEISRLGYAKTTKKV
jgi:flavin reductase (DIM6/NTAB) family NADH-FMN oxidoreductase RutF